VKPTYIIFREIAVEFILTKIKSEIEATTGIYNIPRSAIISIALAPFVIIIFYTIFLIYPETRSMAIKSLDENYPVEFITFGGLFLGGIRGMSLAWKAMLRKKPRALVGFYFLFSAGLIFTGMEEISWGQTFFRNETPFELIGLNRQFEINFHNLGGLHGHSEFFHLAFGVGGLVGIWFFIREKFQPINVPTVFGSWFLCISFISAIDLVGDYYTIYQKLETLTTLLAEVIEMLIGIAGFLYIWLNARALSYGTIRGIPVAKDVDFDEKYLMVHLGDGRRLSIPLVWFPRLGQSDPHQKRDWSLAKNGKYIFWTDLNFEISVDQLVAGIPATEFYKPAKVDSQPG